MQVIIPSLVAEDRSPVKEDNGVVLGAGIAAVQEGGYTIWSDDVWVRNEVQRWISGAGSVHEALRASPARVPESPARNREKVDGEEDERGVGAEDVGLVGEVRAVEAGAVDGEVGHSRRVDEPEGDLDGLALRGVVAFRCPQMRADLWSKTQSGRLERRLVVSLPATCGSIGAAKRKEMGESTIGSRRRKLGNGDL
jgi:hypothetical protein